MIHQNASHLWTLHYKQQSSSVFTTLRQKTLFGNDDFGVVITTWETNNLSGCHSKPSVADSEFRRTSIGWYIGRNWSDYGEGFLYEATFPPAWIVDVCFWGLSFGAWQPSKVLPSHCPSTNCWRSAFHDMVSHWAVRPTSSDRHMVWIYNNISCDFLIFWRGRNLHPGHIGHSNLQYM